MSEDQFLPQGYETPSSSGGRYTKLDQGVTKVRILTQPLIGWELWIKNSDGSKPVRYGLDDRPTSKPQGWDGNPEKHFWAMIVYNHTAERIQILEITQKGIQKRIEELSRSSDWGSPFHYDIELHRKGEGLKTEYSVVPCPPKDLPEEAVSKIQEEVPNINLNALISGDDPFKALENGGSNE